MGFFRFKASEILIIVINFYLCQNNINEVIRAVLNPVLQKRFCTHHKHQKHQKHQKHKDSTKQKQKNANKRKKLKICLKISKGKKVTYSLICVFLLFVHAKKTK